MLFPWQMSLQRTACFPLPSPTPLLPHPVKLTLGQLVLFSWGGWQIISPQKPGQSCLVTSRQGESRTQTFSHSSMYGLGRVTAAYKCTTLPLAQ